MHAYPYPLLTFCEESTGHFSEDDRNGNTRDISEIARNFQDDDGNGDSKARRSTHEGCRTDCSPGTGIDWCKPKGRLDVGVCEDC